MRWLKDVLPDELKRSIHRVIDLPGKMLSPVFSKARVLASFYYLFSPRFGREQQAVLAGRNAYFYGLKGGKQVHMLLRRNIHRLEKGLIMRPRKESFAEGFINETVNYYRLYIGASGSCTSEMKWFSDVLKEYFSIVKDTNKIFQARELYESVVEPLGSLDVDKYSPYPYSSLPDVKVSFNELNSLFTKRRSVRWYREKEVPIELIEKAAGIATLAPSACNRQPYFFYVSANKSKGVEMAKCAGGTSGWAENIPCTIAVIGDLSAYPHERDRHLIYIDASLAAMQLMLALEVLGLSSCSINWPDIESAERRLSVLLSLETYQRPVMLISVGYAQDSGGIPYSQKKGPDVLVRKVS